MRTAIAAAVLTTAALTVGLAGAASAQQYGVDDPRDTSHGSDIRSLHVRHGAENVTVTTRHTDLRRDPATGSGGATFIDTDPTDRGPEYVLVGGYFVGTDYILLDTEGFAHKQWGNPVEHGDYNMRIDYAADKVRIRIQRAALGDPDAVRVAVRASGTRSDGTSRGLTDWVGERRSFTPWLEARVS